MPEVEFEIQSNVATPSRDPARAGKIDRLITFTSSDGRAGFVKVPEEASSLDAVKAAILAELRKQGALTGQKFRATL